MDLPSRHRRPIPENNVGCTPLGVPSYTNTLSQRSVRSFQICDVRGQGKSAGSCSVAISRHWAKSARLSRHVEVSFSALAFALASSLPNLLFQRGRMSLIRLSSSPAARFKWKPPNLNNPLSGSTNTSILCPLINDDKISSRPRRFVACVPFGF